MTKVACFIVSEILFVRKFTSSSMSGDKYSSASIVKYHLPVHLSITAFLALAKSLIQTKSKNISAYLTAISRVLSVEPVSAIISSQGIACLKGSSALRHFSRHLSSFFTIIPIESNG